MINKTLDDLLEKNEIIKIQFNVFEHWYRVDNVETDAVLYTKHGPLDEFTFEYPIILGELAYAFESQIKNDWLFGADIARAIPEHIAVVNKNNLDLRTTKGESYQFAVELNSGS